MGQIRSLLWNGGKKITKIVYAAFTKQYAKEGVIGKVTLLLLPATLTLYFTPIVLSKLASTFETIFAIFTLLIICIIGWAIGSLTRRAPAFPITVIYLTLLGICFWNPPFISSQLSMEALAIIKLILSGAMISTVLSFLRTKDPKSPFILGRIYSSVPLKYKPIADIFGIIVATALILLILFKGEELPKFAYNYLEIASNRDMMIISKQSYDIDDLIERKRNQSLEFSDMQIITTTYMKLFDEQQMTLDDFDSILSRQSNIPFLPTQYQKYHALKKQWLDAHTRWFTSFHTIKKLEKQEVDLLTTLTDAQAKIHEINTVGQSSIQTKIQAATDNAKEIQKTLKQMNTDHRLTEDLEDYFAIEAKRIIDISSLISQNLNATDISPDVISKMKEIGQRDRDLDYVSIYAAWRKAIIEPINEEKLKALDQSELLSEQILDIVHSQQVLTDEITSLFKKLHLYPNEQLPDMNENPLPLLQSELTQYYKVYESPYVIHLRKALNAYLEGKNTSVNTATQAISAETVNDIINGLDSFDRSYYKSKFIVLTVDDNVAGGKYIKILFQEKPDRIFNAWVYQLSNGSYELRTFGSEKNQDPDKMKFIQKEFKTNIEDTVHSL